jgi:oxaloacetate decarboxylase (Na+ extruding) subunit gamma
MSPTPMLIESLVIMLIGMTIVFSFLLLLVGILRVMSWAALRISPIAIEPEPMPSSALVAAGGADAAPLAVIVAAVARYRADHVDRRR